MAAQRGDAADRLVPASPVAQPALLGLMLLLAAASVAGLPPLSGFIGKLMILQASSAHALQATVWAVVLGAGFLTLVGLARAGSVLFWNVNQALPRSGASGASASLVGAALLAAGLPGVLMSLLAAPIQRYTAAAAAAAAGPRGLCPRRAAARRAKPPRARGPTAARPGSGAAAMSAPQRDPTARPGWLPHPALSLVLGLAWLLLQQSLAPAQLLWAVVLALALPRLVHGFIGDSVRRALARARCCGWRAWCCGTSWCRT